MKKLNAADTYNPIYRTYLWQLVAKFNTTFSVSDTPLSDRSSVTPENVQYGVLGQFVVNPNRSVLFVNLNVRDFLN